MKTMTPESIAQLRQKFLAAENAYEDQEELHQLRKALETVISDLENQICRSRDEATSDRARSELKEKKLELQEVDHKLDLLDDQPEVQLDSLKRDLVDAILNKHPSEKAEEEARQVAESRLQEKEQVIQQVIQACDGLSLHLQAVANLWQQSFIARAILFIWGQSFTAQVSDSLAKAAVASDYALETLTEYENEFTDPNSAKNAEQLRSFLSKMQVECRERWGFRKIRQVFVPAAHTLTVLIKRLQDEREVLEAEKHQLQQDFETWIAKF